MLCNRCACDVRILTAEAKRILADRRTWYFRAGRKSIFTNQVRWVVSVARDVQANCQPKGHGS
jgi:hypothetical protein